jgi:hypothetical protein
VSAVALDLCHTARKTDSQSIPTSHWLPAAHWRQKRFDEEWPSAVTVTQLLTESFPKKRPRTCLVV